VERPELGQPLDGTRQRELRAAQTFDEVAAAADTEGLECAQLPVHGAVPTGNPLAAHAVARDDALPLEQQLCERARIGTAREEPVGEGPAPLRRRNSGGTLAREATRPAARRPRGLVAAPCAERRPRVVCHLAGPDEIPQRRQRDLRLELRRGDEVVPELRRPREHLADLVVCLALRPRRSRGTAERGRVVAEVHGNAIETSTYPHDFTGSAELVELSGAEPGDSARQHLRLPQRDR